MRWLVKLMLRVIVPAAVVLLPALFLARAVDREPLVVANSELLFDSAKDAHAFLRRYDPRDMSPDEATEVTATDLEINTAIAAALAGLGFVKSRVAVTPFGLVMAATITLPIPDTPLGRYVNLRLIVPPSSTGVQIARFAVGDNNIPPPLIMPALRFGIDKLLGDGKGAAALGSVKSVAMQGHSITIAFQPPATLVSDVTTAARRVISAADAETVRAYYRRLIELDRIFSPARSLSLSSFIGPLFDLAKSRSTIHDPVEENRALILAMAMFFGDERFERLIGEVRTDELAEANVRTEHVKLEARHDWVQHFVVSAGLAAAGGRSITNVIGEAKEIVDTDGPSGFSFTDIAADRTGVRFAEVATQSSSRARRLQQALAGTLSESDFFPPVGDLPEGLSETQFKYRYGDVNTPAYSQMIAEIDRRIASIALYQ